MHSRRPLTHAILALTLIAPAIATAGTEPKAPVFSLGMGMAARAFAFAPHVDAPFQLAVSPIINGYTDENDPDNRVEAFSANGHFIGIEDADGNLSYVSSNFATVAELRNAIADPNGWTLRVTDGATDTVYDFHFNADASLLADEFLRPIVFTNVAPADLISNFPTFQWTQEPTSNPDAQYVEAYSQLYSNDFLNIYTSPGVNVNDTSWSPTGPVARNTYTIFIGTSNNFPRQDLISVTFDPLSRRGGGGPPPATIKFFGPYVSVSAFSYVPGLTVPCTGDLNGDNTVNVADLTRFLGQFGKNCSEITGICADFNNDNVVNVSDLTTFLGRFGSTCG